MRRQNPTKNSNFSMNSTRQLIDSLTSHLSLYNSSCPNPNPNSNPKWRSSIIKWFSSLTVHQRQAHLTAVDFKFAQILLQMLHKLRSNGNGCFFVLPDVPGDPTSRDHLACSSHSLPSLCFRKSHGLLARVADSNESEQAIRDSVRLFSSKEGENVADFLRLGGNDCIDSMTVSEEFVENVDRFVGIMDDVSDGAFLKGEESGELAAEWSEMEWLKAKGYYTMEAFVANKLEVALRLAWLNCNNSGKKRGVKLKEKINAACSAVNMFWRKKGCIDWWVNLDEEIKKKVFRITVAKAAKCLSAETFKGKHSVEVNRLLCSHLPGEQPLGLKKFLPDGESILCNQGPDARNGFSRTSIAFEYPSQLKCMYSSLVLLQDAYFMLAAYQHCGYDADKMFFSSLNSISTTTDCMLRKMREILMVISLDCTKFELLDEGTTNLSTKKQKEKLAASNHKKKAKNRSAKKLHSVARSSGNDNSPVKPAKENGTGLACSRSTFRPSSELVNESQACSNRDKKGNIQNPPRKKSKKEKNKHKSSCSQRSAEIECCETREGKAASVPVLHQGGVLNSNCIAEDPVVDNGSNSISNVGCKSSGLKNCQIAKLTSSTNGAGACAETAGDGAHEATTPVVHLNGQPGCMDVDSANCKQQTEVVTKLIPSGKLSEDCSSKEKSIPLRGHGGYSVCDMGIINSSTYISYEWPSVPPPQLPLFHAHLPAATDRLHLDVGYNWHNHFHQPIVPAVHRVRNASVENGCGGVVSRPVPMSLDWPPIVRGVNGVNPSVACNYDSGFISRRQNSIQQSFSASSAHCSMINSEDDVLDFSDDQENQWMSEEELELHAVSGMDYNQYFGGGVMYWNPSDFPGSSFSRPPSLSSDDSSWAWREADISRAVDDMVAFSSSYSTNGLTSPSAAPFSSPFDPVGPGNQPVGYVLSDSEIGGKILHSSATVADFVADENISGSLTSMSVDGEAKAGDSLHYPILPPIIIPSLPRDLPKSDTKRNDHKSPCVPPNGREHRIKRPPSPVVLCVPRAPRPPPPSPVGDSRRHRGFPTVRSGSSSPRHWGIKGWSHDGINFEEACMRMDGSEVVWPSWRNKSLQARKLTQPVPGALLQDRLIAISQLTRDQEHPDIAFPLQPTDLHACSAPKASISVIHTLLHNEIDTLCKQVASENFSMKPSINWAVKRVTRSLQVLWPRSRTNIFGSNATGLSLPSSDVDLVVCLPPVRNLEPIKEAGILEGRNGIKETCLQHAARYLANQEWVKNDSLKIVENTAIPIIMLVVEVPQSLIGSSAANVLAPKRELFQNTSEESNSFFVDPARLEASGLLACPKLKHECDKDVKPVRLDISFKSPSHTGLQTTELVKELTEQFPAAKPLAIVLKMFLADRSLDQSYSGGLSSYCLLLLIIRFLQHEHHLGRSISQNYGSLLMDFLYFFGNVFDPRQMRISVQGSGMYMKRVQGCSIDPIYIDDPLFPANNVGRNCFRIHQCIKAFADAYSTLENELICLPSNDDLNVLPPCKLLPKIIPSIDHSDGS
ncbi:OLC1v1002131C1 [Oldenlandia corymbosa var. corymbosa]|uniref:OLC1v1002131C1 n=1 Tax=Oldenlandia corymbosa var. corymbosa TaxID=529605 RepID=A0AAV1D9E7_OLDCO|nr:OLC1v1002131C1 [Oldenlandia corymbosa var. corymbosa]